MQIKENDTLVLLNIHPNASGIYECEVSNIEEVRKEQELIVYGKITRYLLCFISWYKRFVKFTA